MVIFHYVKHFQKISSGREFLDPSPQHQLRRKPDTWHSMAPLQHLQSLLLCILCHLGLGMANTVVFPLRKLPPLATPHLRQCTCHLCQLGTWTSQSRQVRTPQSYRLMDIPIKPPSAMPIQCRNGPWPVYMHNVYVHILAWRSTTFSLELFRPSLGNDSPQLLGMFDPNFWEFLTPTFGNFWPQLLGIFDPNFWDFLTLDMLIYIHTPRILGDITTFAASPYTFNFNGS